MKVTVVVRLKEGILDPQGEAVGSSLRQLGFPVVEARIGRVVDVDVQAASTTEARGQVERMCERLLANPLIESYDIFLSSDEHSLSDAYAAPGHTAD
jgi:phosphoribosylformylglycinamidine synthase subunit PurS